MKEVRIIGLFRNQTQQESKIGWGQLCVLLLLSRMFSGALTFPYKNINYEMQRFPVLICGWALTALVFMPLFFLAERNGGNIFTVLKDKSNALAVIVGIMYCLLLFYLSVQSCVKLEIYVSNTIVPSASNLLLIVLTLSVCLYAVFKGVSVLARTANVVLVLFGTLILLVSLSVVSDMNPEFLYFNFSDGAHPFFQDVLTEFSKNSELLLFAVFVRNTGAKARRSLLYIPIGGGIALWVTFMYMTVLGAFLNRVTFPFNTLSALSDIVMFSRLDGIDVAVWTLTAIVKISLFTLAIQSVLETLFGEKCARICALVSIPLNGAASVYFSLKPQLLLVLGEFYANGLILFVFGGIIPLLVLIFAHGRKKNEKNLPHIAVDTLD